MYSMTFVMIVNCHGDQQKYRGFMSQIHYYINITFSVMSDSRIGQVTHTHTHTHAPGATPGRCSNNHT